MSQCCTQQASVVQLPADVTRRWVMEVGGNEIGSRDRSATVAVQEAYGGAAAAAAAEAAAEARSKAKAGAKAYVIRRVGGW